jgi:hypothetical protein
MAVSPDNGANQRAADAPAADLRRTAPLAPGPNPASLVSLVGMIVGTVGIFFGFYFLAAAPRTALDIVTTTTVGVVGVLAFVRHVFFFRSDAQRLGWQTDHPDWIFEVGFANLSFGVMGLVGGLASGGTKVQALVLLGYALYLFQAAMLHLYRHLTDARRSPARLWRSVLTTLLFVAMLTFFGVRAWRA